MDSLYLVTAVGGLCVVLLGMLIVVMIARTLDRDRAAERAAFERLFTTSPASGIRLPGLGAMGGPASALLAAANFSVDDKTAEAQRKQRRTLIAVLAVVGSIFAIIVGALTDE